MILPTATYSAYRGYDWSSIPEGLTKERLNALCRSISTLRGDFPNPMQVEAGIVTNGDTAAAFTLQNIEHWDAEGRSSDYFAFAFFPVAAAVQIDFVALLNNDFFWTPSHEPMASLDYVGPSAEACTEDVMSALRVKRRAMLENPHSVGSVLVGLGTICDSCICRLYEGNTLEIRCNPMKSKKEHYR